MLNKPDKQLNTGKSFVPKKGQLSCLSGDERFSGCPFLGPKDLSESQLGVLADIIFEQFLLEHNKQNTS